MTTFQDPPPQSRRSARQSERSEETDAPADFAESAPPSEPVSAAEPTLPAPYEQFPPATSGASDDQPLTRSARRAREAAQPGLYTVPSTADGEPLDYMTQGRDEPLSYQAPEPQLPPAPRPDSQLPAAAPAPVQPIGQALVVEMGAEPVIVAEADREAYAEAIATATSFSTAIVGQAIGILQSIGMESPGGVLAPLVRSAVENALASGRPDTIDPADAFPTDED